MQTLIRIVLAAAYLLPKLAAQTSPTSPPDSVMKTLSTEMKSTVANISEVHTPTTMVMIENRARTLQNHVSASGTEYFSVKFSDLAGKTSEEVIQRLAPPPISASDGVRKVEVVVDVEHPITIVAKPRESVLIGTTVVKGPVPELEVHTSILNSEIKVISK